MRCLAKGLGRHVNEFVEHPAKIGAVAEADLPGDDADAVVGGFEFTIKDTGQVIFADINFFGNFPARERMGVVLMKVGELLLVLLAINLILLRVSAK